MNEVQLKRAMADLLAGEPTAPVDARPALAHGKAARRTRRLKITAGTAAVAVALLAAAVPASRSFLVGDRAQPAAPKIKPTPTPSPLPLRTSPYVGYPDSIAVIGHTTALGQASDPDHLALRVQANRGQPAPTARSTASTSAFWQFIRLSRGATPTCPTWTPRSTRRRSRRPRQSPRDPQRTSS